MELYRLAESCDYGDLKDEMIRDRLVVGIRDVVLSRQLQLDPDLTLEKAKKMVRQQEAVHDQQQVLKGVSYETHVIEELRTKGRSTQPSGSTTKPKWQHQRQPQNQPPEAVYTMRQRSASKAQMSSKGGYVLPLQAQRSFQRTVLLQICCRIVKRQLPNLSRTKTKPFPKKGRCGITC